MSIVARVSHNEQDKEIITKVEDVQFNLGLLLDVLHFVPLVLTDLDSWMRTSLSKSFKISKLDCR